MEDLSILREALGVLMREAAALRWADERPWSPSTHVSFDTVPTIDLHDLSVNLGKRAVDVVVEVQPQLSTGAVVFVTGVGRHALNKRSELASAVSGKLAGIAHDRGWDWRPARPGAFALIWDGRRTPSAIRGDLGWPFWLGVGVFVVVGLYACFGLGRPG